MSDKEKFIRETLGDEILTKVRNIHRGGHNANKGQAYEEQFVLFKVLELASSKRGKWGDHIISRQNLDFFDDISHIDQVDNIKHNYQAKNSSLSTADWNDEHSKRARYQIKVDADFHMVKSSKNYLVVSEQYKQNNNLSLIPEDLKECCDCIYFPYSSEQLEKQNFEPYLSYMTKSHRPDDQDYALNVLRGALSNNINSKTIKDIFSGMKSYSYPNPFIEEYEEELPIFIVKHLKEQGLPYQYNGDNLIIHRPIEIKVPRSALSYIEQNKLQELNTKQETCLYLISIVSKILKGNE